MAEAFFFLRVHYVAFLLVGSETFTRKLNLSIFSLKYFNTLTLSDGICFLTVGNHIYFCMFNYGVFIPS